MSETLKLDFCFMRLNYDRVNIHVSYAVYFSFSTATYFLVVNPILVYSHGFLFHCMKVDQSSDSMKTLTENFHPWVGA